MDARLKFLASVSAAEPDALRSRLGAPIEVHCSERTLATRSGQALIYQLVTLLARLFDHVELTPELVTAGEVPACLLAIPGLSGPIAVAVRAAAQGARTREDVVPRQDLHPYRILVGDTWERAGRSAELRPYDLFVGATGWTAGVSVVQPVPVLETETMVGPLAAGALAAGEAFKHIFSDALQGALVLSRGGIEHYSLSLLTYRVSLTPFVADDEPALENTLHTALTLFGCGSLGCGFLLGVVLTPQLVGTLATVDNGVFDERNPFKYTLLSAAEARAKLSKATWAADLFHNRPDLIVTSFRGTAAEYVEEQPADYRLPLVISAVDTLDARLEVQDTLPGRIVNAGVRGTTAEVSVHGFGEGACLACLGITAQRESWSARAIADRIGLTALRTRALILGNLPLEREDLAKIREANVVKPELLADLDTYLGEPVMSFYNRAAYAETAVRTASGVEALVTTAFVSAFAGILLLAETLKQASPSLHLYRVDNSYRQELLGVPTDDRLRYPRDDSGWCICHSGFRQTMYRKKYGLATEVAHGIEA